MVMVYEGSDSDSSDGGKGRHDRFRSERVLLKSSPDNLNSRPARHRSRSPNKDRYSSHKRHYSDRREEERPPKRRSEDNYRSSKERSNSRHSPVSKKNSSENDKDNNRESSRHLDSKRHEHSRSTHDKERSKSSYNCKKYRSDHDRHSKERDKSKKEYKTLSMVEDKKHYSERDKHGSDSEKRIKYEDKNKTDKDKSNSSKLDKHKKISNDERKPNSLDAKRNQLDNDRPKSVDGKLRSKDSEESNTKITPDKEINSDAKGKDKTLIGPILPPYLQKDSDEIGGKKEKTKKTGSEEECYGPVLPPGHRETSSQRDREMSSQRDREMSSQRDRAMSEEDRDGNISHGDEPAEDSIGPQLPGSTSTTQLVLDHRASIIKKQMENKDGDETGRTKKREEWMTELPKNKGVTGLGLEARKFRQREAPSRKDSDTSAWTDTPADKEKKLLLRQMGHDGAVDVQEEHRLAVMKERDEEMEKLSKKSKKDKKRGDKSLLEMHQKALKKKKKKEKKERDGRKEERRPFDRNIDLQANRLDEAQRKAVFKKAQLLDSRFSFGESKYL